MSTESDNRNDLRKAFLYGGIGTLGGALGGAALGSKAGRFFARTLHKPQYSADAIAALDKIKHIRSSNPLTGGVLVSLGDMARIENADALASSLRKGSMYGAAAGVGAGGTLGAIGGGVAANGKGKSGGAEKIANVYSAAVFRRAVSRMGGTEKAAAYAMKDVPCFPGEPGWEDRFKGSPFWDEALMLQAESSKRKVDDAKARVEEEQRWAADSMRRANEAAFRVRTATLEAKLMEWQYMNMTTSSVAENNAK